MYTQILSVMCIKIMEPHSFLNPAPISTSAAVNSSYGSWMIFLRVSHVSHSRVTVNLFTLLKRFLHPFMLVKTSDPLHLPALQTFLFSSLPWLAQVNYSSVENGCKSCFFQEAHCLLTFCCSALGDGLAERVCAEDNMQRSWVPPSLGAGQTLEITCFN